MYFLVALAAGVFIGAIACLPEPHKTLRAAWFSVALGLVGSFAGWQASVLLGEGEVGPVAQLFVAIVAAGALVSVYHAFTSERPRLR